MSALQANSTFGATGVSVIAGNPTIFTISGIGDRLTFDSATNTYTLYEDISPQPPSDPWPTAVFPASENVGGAANFLTRRHVYNGVLAPSYNQEELRIFIPGSANTQLSLSYVTYGLRMLWATTSPLENRVYFIFGVSTPTADLPLSGTATFSGVADGAFTDGVARYTVSGTSTLSADFAANTVAASLNLTGVAQLAGATAFTPVLYSGQGTIDRAHGAGLTQYSGTLTSSGNPTYTGSFKGGFFGPAANEFGFTFQFGRGVKSSSNPGGGAGNGVAVGKQ